MADTAVYSSQQAPNGPTSGLDTGNALGSGQQTEKSSSHPFLSSGAGGATVHDASAASPNVSPDAAMDDIRRRTMNITVVDNVPVSENCWPEGEGKGPSAAAPAAGYAVQPGQTGQTGQTGLVGQTGGQQEYGQATPSNRSVRDNKHGSEHATGTGLYTQDYTAQQHQQQQQQPQYQQSQNQHQHQDSQHHQHSHHGIETYHSNKGQDVDGPTAQQKPRTPVDPEKFDVADRRLDRDPNAPRTPPPDPMKGGILGLAAGAGGAGLAQHIYADHQSPTRETGGAHQFAAPQPTKPENFNSGANQSLLAPVPDNDYEQRQHDENIRQQQLQQQGGYDQQNQQQGGYPQQQQQQVYQDHHDHSGHHGGAALAGGALAGGALAAGHHGNGEPRPSNHRLSRSYLNEGQQPVQTRYERPLEDGSLSRRSTTAGGRPEMGSRTNSQRKSAKIANTPPVFVENIPRSQSRSSYRQPKQDPYADPVQRPATAHGHPEYPSPQRRQQQQPPLPGQQQQRPASATGHRDHSRRSSYNRPGQDLLSPSQSHRGRLPPIADDAAYGAAGGAGAGLALGEVASLDRQHEIQANGVPVNDEGPVPPYPPGARPRSQFGYRPEPQYADGYATGRPESRYSRAGAISRSGTLGRNGTLQRAANGGTIGSRRGAFGRGAGMSVGTQPEEILGRDDIHTRAELSERALDEATLRKLSAMEKKDAKKLAKLLRSEGKEQARAVDGQIKDMKRLARLQREAIGAERKSQHDLAKWTTREHKARMRFLKEKERYEKVEGELRNAENDYEERRDQAAGLTAQIAEKTQELDDMRAQKAADDREREVKLIALKNPAHA